MNGEESLMDDPVIETKYGINPLTKKPCKMIIITLDYNDEQTIEREMQQLARLKRVNSGKEYVSEQKQRELPEPIAPDYRSLFRNVREDITERNIGKKMLEDAREELPEIIPKKKRKIINFIIYLLVIALVILAYFLGTKM